MPSESVPLFSANESCRSDFVNGLLEVVMIGLLLREQAGHPRQLLGKVRRKSAMIAELAASVATRPRRVFRRLTAPQPVPHRSDICSKRD